MAENLRNIGEFQFVSNRKVTQTAGGGFQYVPCRCGGEVSQFPLPGQPDIYNLPVGIDPDSGDIKIHK